MGKTPDNIDVPGDELSVAAERDVPVDLDIVVMQLPKIGKSFTLRLT